MAKNGNAPDPFDVLNSELNGKAIKSSGVNSRGVNPDTAKKSEPMRATIPQTNHSSAPNTAQKAVSNGSSSDLQPVKGAKAASKSNKSRLKSCVGYIAKGIMIIFLAVLIAWIIFMPSGSLSELKDHITKSVFGATAIANNLDGQDVSVDSDDSTSTMTAADSASTTEQTESVEESVAPEATTTTATTTITTTTAAAVVTTTTSKTTTKTTTKTKAPTTNNTNSQDTTAVSSPYYIHVYLKSQVVVVYDLDDDVRIAFTCSSGKASTPTRTGSYKIHSKYRWRLMIGNCYTQYASSFSSGYLFHSIPYNQRSASTMSNDSYDKLGSPASSGCIRLCFRDSKWIYDNCPIGTSVRVVDDYAPTVIVTQTIVPRINSADYSGWDPTDTDENNPYNN